MRLIVCAGHEKPITRVKFNRDGDLCFSSSNDNTLSVWNPQTGERLGTFEGHNGAIADFDVDFNSNYLVTAGLDSKLKLFAVRNGNCLFSIDCLSRVRCVEFSLDNKKFFGIKPPFARHSPEILIFDNPLFNDKYELIEENEPQQQVTIDISKQDDVYNEYLTNLVRIPISNPDNVKNFNITRGLWSPLNKFIYCVCSDGSIRIVNVSEQKEVNRIIFDNQFEKTYGNIKDFTNELTNIKYFSNIYTMVIVTSRSNECKIYDISGDNKIKWKEIQKFKAGRSLNTMAVHPKYNIVCMGGGKTAMQAALDRKSGNYEILLFHLYFRSTEQDLTGNTNGSLGIIPSDCFSPLNTMTWSPDGNIFVAGFEEGQIRIYIMDKKFFNEFKQIEKQFTQIKQLDDEI